MLFRDVNMPKSNNVCMHMGLPRWLRVKKSASNAGDAGFISGLGRSPGEVNGNPLQYSCLGNPMDRGTWWAKVHGTAEMNMTQRLNMHALCMHISVCYELINPY